MLNMIKFQLKQLWKMPVMLINIFLYPVILTAIIGYLTQGNFGGEITSYQFYAIGMMIFIFTGGGLTSVYNFIDKSVKDGNFRSMFTPVKTPYIYLSQIISGTLYCMGAIIFSMVIFKLFFGLNYNGNSIVIFLALATLTFLSNALGIFLCTLISDPGPINMVYNLIQAVFCILGGAFFSMEALGGVAAKLSLISPIKWVIDGILNSMYDGKIATLLMVILINIILALLLIILSERTFKTEKYL